MKTTAIILAGGRGSRMKSDIPKQYLLIGGKPLLYHTLVAFDRPCIDEIVLVCGLGDEETVKTIVNEAGIGKDVKVVFGGKERYDSVYNALLACGQADYVLIHDGARCCISPALIDRIADCGTEGKNVIAAVPVNDTVKVVDKDGSVKATLDRSSLFAVQTPQAFSYGAIICAHEAFRAELAKGGEKAMGITDDSMIMERFSDEKVFIIEGEYSNIKVTTPADLELAERYLGT